MSADHVEIHAIFHGNVQGVGFRATAQALAQATRLTGTVSNQTGGSVELFAVGSKEELERFIESIKKRFHPSTITRVDISYTRPSKDYSGFSVLRP